MITSGIPVYWFILFSQPLDTGSTTHVLQLILLPKQETFEMRGEIRRLGLLSWGMTYSEISIQRSEYETHLAFHTFLPMNFLSGLSYFKCSSLELVS
jgi:hypothetical protein